MGKTKSKLQRGLIKYQAQKLLLDKKKCEATTKPNLKNKTKSFDKYNPAKLDRGISKLKQKIGQLSEEDLRVYNKERLKHSKFLYEASDRILLLGEGNFSFARALCKIFGDGTGIWATCLDSEDILKQKYGEDCTENIDFIKGCGGKVFYDIDGTKLEKHRKVFLSTLNNEEKDQGSLAQRSTSSSYKNDKEIFYDKIVINFPHCGLGIKDQRKNILANQRLLLGIFKSARCLAQPTTGELHITIRSGLPYEQWRVVALAKEEGHWHLSRCIPFNPDLYPGYEHRRTLGFESSISSSENQEIKDKYPRTYVFCLIPDESAS